jgi:hypothetical protein
LRVAPGATEGRSAAARSPKAKTRATSFRLTLSRPEDDDVLQRVLALKRSEDLLSLATPQREYSEAERESLRLQARMALSDNPVAEAIQMQARLGALESNMGALKKQMVEVEAARTAAEESSRRLAEENKRLAARIDTFGIMAVLLVCVGMAAVGFWRYRVASERRAQLTRDWDAVAETPSAGKSPDSPPDPPGLPETQARSSDFVPQAQYARTVVLDRTGTRLPAVASSPLSATSPSPQLSPAAPASGRLDSPATGQGATIAPPPAVPIGAVAPLELPPAPPAKPVAPVSVESPATATADDGMFLPESALKKKGADESALPDAAGSSSLIEKAFGFGPGTSQGGAASIRPTTGRGKTLPSAGMTQAGQPDSYALTLPPITGRGRTLQGDAGGPARAPEHPAKAAPKTGAPIDFTLAAPDHASLDSVTDAEAKARVEQYLGEFERKLFPEIALGRVKLDEPRSIIGLARTYYQEDFDPAKAVSFLEYALHRSTDPMLIHLALLEVLRMERRVREFASVARAFRGQYPDSGTYWQLIAAYGRMLDPSDPAFEGERVPGLDLDTPSNWLGNTIDMTKYVLGQKVADSVRDLPEPVSRGHA